MTAGAVLEHTYTPRGAAKDLFEYRGTEALLAGAAGTGKSRACLEKLHMLALLNPGMRGLMVRKTAVSLTSTGLVTFKKKVAEEAIKAGIVRWYGGSKEEAAAYRYSNGSLLNVGGMDKPDKIMSSEYDAIYVQEATELGVEDWEACTSRLRNGVISFQQLVADCNPSSEHHWLKQRANLGSTKLLNSRHEDNPVYFDDDGNITEAGRAYIGILDMLTGVRKLRLRYGLWAAAEGMVYEDWDDNLHWLDPRPIPADWTRWWTVDFGFTNPFVCQFWAEDPDGRLYLYREIYRTKRLVEDHAKDIIRIVAPGGEVDKDGVLRHGTWREPKPRAIICDHDAEDRATLEKHVGMSTVAATKTKKEGLQAVQARMKKADDGRVRLMILRDALVERDKALELAKLPMSTVEEVGGYVWNEAKDEPVKKDDHGMDAMRYMVAERDLGARPRIRVMGGGR